MISAISGSNASALLSLFGRTQATTAATPTQTSQTSAPPPPPLPQGNGVSAQSLFDALVHAGQGGTAGTGRTSLDDLLSNVVASHDSDGDGKLNPTELKSAFASLTGTALDAESQTQTTAATPTKSLYESLFNALASDDGSLARAARNTDLSQKFLSALEA